MDDSKYNEKQLETAKGRVEVVVGLARAVRLRIGVWSNQATLVLFAAEERSKRNR